MNSPTVASWEQQEIVRLLKGAPGTAYQEADDTNKQIMRDWVRSLLQKQPATITFIKADGSERAMQCTLNWNFIPSDKQPKMVSVQEAKQQKEPDVHSLRVFDIEKQEWRSFRFDRLKSIGVELKFS